MRQQTDLDVQIPIERFDSVDSTSARARKAVETGELGGQARLFVAQEQTAGKGRFGRAWSSPKGGVWCTLAWPVNLDPARILQGLGLRIGLACIHALEHTLAAHGHGEPVRLKWPNDILIKGRKVAGVLTEVLEKNGKTYVLVGVGVNANFPVGDLPEAIRAASITLADEIGRHVNTERLIQDLRRELRDALMTEGLPEGVHREITQHLHGVGQRVTITLPDRSTRTGSLLGLSTDGRIKLGTDEGEWTAPPSAELMPPEQL